MCFVLMPSSTNRCGDCLVFLLMCRPVNVILNAALPSHKPTSPVFISFEFFFKMSGIDICS